MHLMEEAVEAGVGPTVSLPSACSVWRGGAGTEQSCQKAFASHNLKFEITLVRQRLLEVASQLPRPLSAPSFPFDRARQTENWSHLLLVTLRTKIFWNDLPHGKTTEKLERHSIRRIHACLQGPPLSVLSPSNRPTLDRGKTWESHSRIRDCCGNTYPCALVLGRH